MIECEIPIATRDGPMMTFIAHPERAGPFPVVLIYMDARGIRDELRDFARRLGTVGYYCVLPDLFHRWGDRFAVPPSPLYMPSAPEMSRALGLAKMLSRDMILADTDAVLTAVASGGSAAKSAKGCIGYCMGGRFVAWALGARPEHFKAGSSMYGTGLCTASAESPHRLANRIEGELYLAFGAKDPLMTAAEIAAFGDALQAATVKHEIEIHADATHGFAFPERTEVYLKAAAERTWERTFALFRRRLEQGTKIGDAVSGP